MNPHKHTLKIDEIRLTQLQNDWFRINVDGVSGTVFNDIEIPGEDYIYIFAEVLMDNPPTVNDPFVVMDEIEYTYKWHFYTTKKLVACLGAKTPISITEKFMKVRM